MTSAKVVLALSLASLTAPCLSSAQAPPSGAAGSRSYVGARTPKDTDGPPLSDAVRLGNTLYLSGKLGLGPDRKPPESVETEVRNALDSMKKTLTEAGMTMDDLVVVQVFCSDVSLYEVFNKVDRTYFTKEYPARAFLGSGPLLFGARFEVQGRAVKR
jgi:enamine deaminase RidA (YjgF/YER057c/UK114 family)